MSLTPEGKVKDAVKKLIKGHKEVYLYMPVPGGYGRPTLDFLGVINGVPFAIETKAPGKRLTPIQANVANEMERAGINVFVINGADEPDLRSLRLFLGANS